MVLGSDCSFDKFSSVFCWISVIPLSIVSSYSPTRVTLQPVIAKAATRRNEKVTALGTRVRSVVNTVCPPQDYPYYRCTGTASVRTRQTTYVRETLLKGQNSDRPP